MKRSVYIICFLYTFSFKIILSSSSIESIYLDLVHKNINNYKKLDEYYTSILHDVRHHRPIDTVSTPINLAKLQSNDYDEEYLKNSCYETTSDLLKAHGFNQTDIDFSVEDLRKLLPAILYSVENPGCTRQSPPTKPHTFTNVWIIGLLFALFIKLTHFLILYLVGDHCLSLTSTGITHVMSEQNKIQDDTNIKVHFPPLQYRLWLGLGFNAFTCGLMLGTIVYHLIPHIYQVPNEDFNYFYLLRASVIFLGVYLFFIVEKLLRFRFKIDEAPSNETDDDNNKNNNDDEELKKLSDPSMMQMARMHGTLHASTDDDHPHSHSDPLARIPLHDDSDEEQSNTPINTETINNEKSSHHHHHHHHEDEKLHKARNLTLYHIINDTSNDLIYGCGLSTALAHNNLIGVILFLMIFSEGFRRHSQTISSLGRKRGLCFIFISAFFLLLGYIIGGILVEINQRSVLSFIYIRTEYIYSIVYGALFYTALVTLIPELNDFGHHLQITLKQANQTSKQRRIIKLHILLCQNIFLLIGVIISLIIAFIWRYYHRQEIRDYVCKRVSSRILCH